MVWLSERHEAMGGVGCKWLLVVLRLVRRYGKRSHMDGLLSLCFFCLVCNGLRFAHSSLH